MNRGPGWWSEPTRHSLASRGIRTRAIPNPIADSSLYDSSLYGTSRKSSREYSGSGLEDFEVDEVVDFVEIRMGRIRDMLNKKSVFLNWFEAEGDDEWIENESSVTGVMHYRKTSVERLYKAMKDNPDLIEVDEIHLIGSRVTGFWRPDSDLDIYVKVKIKPELLEVTGGSDRELIMLLEVLRDYARVTSEYDYENNMSINHILTDVVRLSLYRPVEPSLVVWRSS